MFTNAEVQASLQKKEVKLPGLGCVATVSAMTAKQFRKLATKADDDEDTEFRILESCVRNGDGGPLLEEGGADLLSPVDYAILSRALNEVSALDIDAIEGN